MHSSYVVLLLHVSYALLICVDASEPTELSGVAAACVFSSLWGQNGEKNNVAGRVYDFSRAGYARGGFLPNLKANTSNWFDVKSFGAKGDAKKLGANVYSGTDDGPAVQTALDKLKDGSVLYFPAGIYTLGKDFIIRKRIVLKGDGMGKTILYFPKSMSDLYGYKTEPDYSMRPECVGTTDSHEDGYSKWAFRNGFIQYQGVDTVGLYGFGTVPLQKTTRLAGVTVNAARGGITLTVDSTANVIPGQWVRIVASDFPKGSPNAGQLIKELYGGYADRLGDTLCDIIGYVWALSVPAQVTSVSANQITIDRPLPVRLDVAQFKDVEIHKFDPSIQRAGIEDLTVRFKGEKYAGHFSERGMNAIWLINCTDMWIKNVEVLNADNYIYLENTHHSTLDGVVLGRDFDRGVPSAHHGIRVASQSSNNLIRNFVVNVKTVHDIDVQDFAHSNVYKNGKGLDINMEHHRVAPNNNLFTNIDLGSGKAGFKSGGKPGIRGANAGANNVYWNIKASKAIGVPKENFGPNLTFVGVNFPTKVKTSGWKYNWVIEFPGLTVCPLDLHAAMVQKASRG